MLRSTLAFQALRRLTEERCYANMRKLIQVCTGSFPTHLRAHPTVACYQPPRFAEPAKALHDSQEEASGPAPRMGELQSTPTVLERGAVIFSQVTACSKWQWQGTEQVTASLDRLGAEALRRVRASPEATQAMDASPPNYLPALNVLNEFMFGQSEEGFYLSHWFHEFNDNPPVPTSGGLHFRGDAETYYKEKNSMIEEVVRCGTGIPITLAIVHHAIGARCGIPVDMAVSVLSHSLSSRRRNGGRLNHRTFSEPFYARRRACHTIS